MRFIKRVVRCIQFNVDLFALALGLHTDAGLGNQAGKQTDHRRHLGASAHDAGNAGGHAGGGLGDFPGEQH